MARKSFFLTLIFSAALFAGCQDVATVLNSTWHKPGDSTPLPVNSMKGENANQSAMNQNMMNRSETNPPAVNAAVNTANKTMNTAKKP